MLCLERVCGQEGQECCPADAGHDQHYCEDDLTCRLGRCRSVYCGEYGQRCCAGDTCTGDDLMCKDGECTTSAPCGAENQVCCPGKTCQDNLFCLEIGLTAICIHFECGSYGESCCPDGSCDEDLECIDD